METKGFSLIETVLYIGLLALLVPSFISVTLGFVQKSDTVDPRIRMEEKASVIFSELHQELAQAQSINITASRLGTDDSILVFVRSTGETITLSRVAQLVSFVGGDQEVVRLRWQSLSGDAWMSDADMDVTVWNVTAARDRLGILTGLNIGFTTQVRNSDGSPFRAIGLPVQTTISLQPQTTEL